MRYSARNWKDRSVYFRVGVNQNAQRSSILGGRVAESIFVLKASASANRLFAFYRINGNVEFVLIVTLNLFEALTSGAA